MMISYNKLLMLHELVRSTGGQTRPPSRLCGSRGSGIKWFGEMYLRVEVRLPLHPYFRSYARETGTAPCWCISPNRSKPLFVPKIWFRTQRPEGRSGDLYTRPTPLKAGWFLCILAMGPHAGTFMRGYKSGDTSSCRAWSFREGGGGAVRGHGARFRGHGQWASATQTLAAGVAGGRWPVVVVVVVVRP